MNSTKRQALITVLATTVSISLFLSFARIWADPVINQDAILYLQAAKFFQAGEWESALALYNWPFFSLSIASLATLTQLPVDLAAYILNSLFVALTCVSFVLIVRELGGSQQRVLWLAALIILCFPSLNDDRTLIIRDHGYWAFLSLSTLFFFQLCKQPNFHRFLLLILCALLATLFRVEGALFLMGLPVMVYLSRINLKQVSILFIGTRALLLLLFFLLCFAGFIWLGENNIAGFNKTSQFSHMMDLVWRAFLDSDSSSSALNKTQQFLIDLGPSSHYSKEYALSILVLLILLILVTETFKTLTPLYLAGLVLCLYFKVGFPNRQQTRPWMLLILIHGCILGAFTTYRFFLAGRYPMALSFILMLPLPFLVDRLLENYQKKTLNLRSKRLAQLGLMLFMLASLDGLISLGASKVYLKQAGLWLAQHTQPDLDKVYFDNDQVRFYSGTEISSHRHDIDIDSSLKKIGRGKLDSYEYLAFNIKHRVSNGEQQLIDALNRQPIKKFENRRQDKVLIFHLPHLPKAQED